MYGCIVYKDEYGVWLLSEGHIEKLNIRISEFKEVTKSAEVKLIEIGEEELECIRDDAEKIEEQFKSHFE